ncbi:MAG: DUF4145 domain-containing protein [Luteibacter jiangsuensis]
MSGLSFSHVLTLKDFVATVAVCGYVTATLMMRGNQSMAGTIVSNCPRCGAQQMTFDVTASTSAGANPGINWKKRFEVFAICRSCLRPSILWLEVDQLIREIEPNPMSFNNLDSLFKVIGFLSVRDLRAVKSPEHIPVRIEEAFNEGARSLAGQCPNAAAAMFRLCVDLATAPLLPDGAEPSNRVRRSLGLRLDWLFNHQKLPEALRELADCLKEDGNDGAHEGTLTIADAENLLDFTVELLKRMFTEPRTLELARLRREERRAAGRDGA